MMVIAEVLVLVFALAIAIVRGLPGPGAKPLRALAIAYTDFFRGTPIIIVAFFVGFGIPGLQLGYISSRSIVTYGVITLAFGIALRVGALAELPMWAAAAALIAAHAAARVTPTLAMNWLSYAGDTASMKVSYADSPVTVDELRFALIAAACALVPLALVSILSVISGLLLGAVLASALAAWAWKLIDGYTGDVLGAIEQMFEIGFLLGAAAVIQ